MKHAVWMLAALLTASRAVGAGEPQPERPEGAVASDAADWLRLEASVAQLNLTDAQRGQVADLLTMLRPDLQRWTSDLARARVQLMKAMYAEAPDEEAIRAGARAAGRCEEELAVLRARMFERLREVLDGGQRRILRRAVETLLESVERKARQREAMIDAWIKEYGDGEPPANPTGPTG